ncbi:MAG: glycerol kinase GlpK [Lachnospiraceae bacterium]|nr:glycerol kinase GlpK [Lachnospiraceae bacterium]
MSDFYILGIDQSTQGTKGVLVDDAGLIVGRADRPHDQLISSDGWVSHNLTQIWENALLVLKDVIEKTGIDKTKIRCLGLTNQRETTAAWSRKDGKPLADAIVWQCARAAGLCEAIEERFHCQDEIYARTGIKLSPFFPASKMAWLLENEKRVREAAEKKELALGTVDSYLLYRLTGGKSFRTDYSNASRTQLMNLRELKWDETICGWFGIPPEALPAITDSDADFGRTDLEGYLPQPIPIHAVLGDSHGALFGHNCRETGGVKATYGTGSSVMLNIGGEFIRSAHGLATSLAWKIGGKASYVLEGNINYTGAVISWLKNDLQLISSPGETGELAKEANPQDTTYLVPAFSGLGAPWWKNDVRALICGMSRTTGKKELVKAACESIAYQITDVLEAMRSDTGLKIDRLCVDGGPTRNDYLMQFQSDISGAGIRIPDAEELSVLGTVYAAGLAAGLYDERVFDALSYREYTPSMSAEERKRRLDGWKEAVCLLLGEGGKNGSDTGT